MQKSTSAGSVEYGSQGMEGSTLPFLYLAEGPLDPIVGWRGEWGEISFP